MRRPRFGLDLDGVVYNWVDTYRFLMRQYRGKALPKPRSWDGLDTSVTQEDRDWLWSDGVRKHGLFRYGHIYKGSVWGLEELSKLTDIIVITHRPANAIDDTLEWLSFMRLPAQEVNFLAEDEPKWTVECDLYLDDAPHNIKGFREHRPRALAMLWARPWNSDYQAEADTVVRSWREVVTLTRAFIKANEF